jgi:hypothetical protein
VAVEGGPPSSTAPPPPSTAPGPDGKPPLKVAVVGDSMADSIGPGMIQWGTGRGDVAVYNLGLSGCPLARGGTRRLSDGTEWKVENVCSWWATPNSDRYVKYQEFDPDIVVIQDGLNELPDRKLPSWPAYWHTGQAQFDSWLVNEYTEAIKSLTAGGAKALFLNAVCVDWEKVNGPFTDYSATYNGDGDARVASLDRTHQAVTATGATIVDFQGHLCPRGKFTSSVDGVSNGRPDGYHFSAEGSYALADRWLGPMVLQEAGPRPVAGV